MDSSRVLSKVVVSVLNNATAIIQHSDNIVKQQSVGAPPHYTARFEIINVHQEFPPTFGKTTTNRNILIIHDDDDDNNYNNDNNDNYCHSS